MTRTQTRKRRSPIKIPRQIVPGASVDAIPGTMLDIIVLGEDQQELFGVELASRAFVRVDLNHARQSHARNDGALDEQEETRARRSVTPHSARFVVGEDEPIDAGRPEAIWTPELPQRTGVLRPRTLRRLLDQVVAVDRPGALVLASRAASISYKGLDPASPSMMVIALHPKACALVCDDPGETFFEFTWGGLRQQLVVHDVRAQSIAREHKGRFLERDALARALGFKIGYALVAYAPVSNGYVRKVVVSLLRR